MHRQLGLELVLEVGRDYVEGSLAHHKWTWNSNCAQALHCLLLDLRSHSYLTASMHSSGNHGCSCCRNLILNQILRERILRFGHDLLSTADLLSKLSQNLFCFKSCVTRMTTNSTFIIIFFALVCIRRLRVQRGRLCLYRSYDGLWIIFLRMCIQIL